MFCLWHVFVQFQMSLSLLWPLIWNIVLFSYSISIAFEKDNILAGDSIGFVLKWNAVSSLRILLFVSCNCVCECVCVFV